ncbi:entry exclusion lipoprotein TrbK [Nitrosomonas sp. Nm34]|uniref:entry exclusion lipoprotein TrbK n=1 Tax=Nitrosomonas sp. Nm34 TaxID=1881055 RepID=UPI0008E26723|nr:entry exclusion lipoprotein TrbK [Nitrosomonas sp. Nm34]SFI30681.1 entry exclusion lipoprotein TrbK [Nitrosomonas sp. Nm34]
MNTRYSVVCIIGLSIALIGCDGGPPEANAVNCSGKGMEKALTAFRNNETERQAFLDKCDALNKAN